MKFRITVNHVFVFDTEHEDNRENVQEVLAAGVEYMLENDLSSVIDVNEIDETDCTIEAM